MTFGGTRAGGSKAADAECQREADDAGLVGEFIAFLPINASVSARQRFDQGTRNIVLPNGAVIATGFITLFGIGPAVPIALTADGMPAPSTDTVYTGSSSADANSPATCAFWTTNASNGNYGSLAKASDWLEAPTPSTLECKTLRRVYCFER